MAQLLVIGWEFLGGASGLYLPEATYGRLSEFQFGSAHNYYWLFLALARCHGAGRQSGGPESAVGLFPFALRDNESAAQAVGVAVLRNQQMAAMVISAALCTWIVARLYARYMSYIDPVSVCLADADHRDRAVCHRRRPRYCFGSVLGALVLCRSANCSAPISVERCPHSLRDLRRRGRASIIMFQPTGIAPPRDRAFRRPPDVQAEGPPRQALMPPA